MRCFNVLNVMKITVALSSPNNRGLTACIFFFFNVGPVQTLRKLRDWARRAVKTFKATRFYAERRRRLVTRSSEDINRRLRTGPEPRHLFGPAPRMLCSCRMGVTRSSAI